MNAFAHFTAIILPNLFFVKVENLIFCKFWEKLKKISKKGLTNCFCGCIMRDIKAKASSRMVLGDAVLF